VAEFLGGTSDFRTDLSSGSASDMLLTHPDHLQGGTKNQVI